METGEDANGIEALHMFHDLRHSQRHDDVPRHVDPTIDEAGKAHFNDLNVLTGLPLRTPAEHARDPSITQTGYQAAMTKGRAVRQHGIIVDAAVSSPYARSIQTAVANWKDTAAT